MSAPRSSVTLSRARDQVILIMTTTAGGVAITVNNSNVVVFMDETWSPDDQEQAEDRSRNNTADIYYIRTKDTIEERIKRITDSKRHTNYNILDLRRLGLRAA